jgi:hypothetical protein
MALDGGVSELGVEGDKSLKVSMAGHKKRKKEGKGRRGGETVCVAGRVNMEVTEGRKER